MRPTMPSVSALALALTLVPWALALVAWRRRHRAAAVTIADAVIWHDVPTSWRERWRRAPAVLRLLALTVLALAAAGPVGVTTRTALVGVPADLLLLIDASGSMQALDVAATRFEAAVALATDVASARAGDRVGVMAFGARTTALMPLTSDLDAVTAALRDARASVVDVEEGTALGAALTSGIALLTGSRGSTGKKTIVVLTDGATDDGVVALLDAARLAAARGVVVHAVGIGRDGRVPYPTEAGIVDVALPVRDELLGRIAADTGGRYWRVTDARALADVAGSLARVDSTPPVRETREVPVSRTRELLLGALLHIAMEAALSAGPLRVDVP
jgi:Ca-activated chloride channel family protein